MSIITGGSACHLGAMHFSCSEEPFEIYFSADNTTRKMLLLYDGSTGASFVIGFSEDEWKTLRADGTIQIEKSQEKIRKIKELHYAKNPSSKKFEEDPNTVFLVFTPTWWRYTDFMEEPVEMIEG